MESSNQKRSFGRHFEFPGLSIMNEGSCILRSLVCFGSSALVELLYLFQNHYSMTPRKKALRR
jgi:hypothetical protein